MVEYLKGDQIQVNLLKSGKFVFGGQMDCTVGTRNTNKTHFLDFEQFCNKTQPVGIESVERRIRIETILLENQETTASKVKVGSYEIDAQIFLIAQIAVVVMVLCITILICYCAIRSCCAKGKETKDSKQEAKNKRSKFVAHATAAPGPSLFVESPELAKYSNHGMQAQEHTIS